jgi:transcriptional regulator with XRE-family HTH domain
MARPKNASPNQRIRLTLNGREKFYSFNQLGDLLMVKRKEKKHTLQEAAAQISQGKWTVSASLISRIEHKKLMPSHDLVVRMLAYVFGSSVVIHPEDTDSTTYKLSTNIVLLENLLSHCNELDASDCQILLTMFSVLSEARAAIRVVQQ